MAKICGISKASVQRIWQANGLKPHLVKTFKLSNDPDFIEKLEDVVGLYMNPPDHARVFCIDDPSTNSATVLSVKGDLPMKVLSAPAGRVKASAFALPLARLAALTRPTAADLGFPSDLRFGMSQLRFDRTPRLPVAQLGVERREGSFRDGAEPKLAPSREPDQRDGQQLARHRDDRDEF